MVIYIGADHRGFKLKEYVKELLKETGYAIVDVGNKNYDEGDDYNDFAQIVSEKVSAGPEHTRGVLICGSGVGMNMVANRFKNVRAGYAGTPDQAFDARSEDDINILVLGANYLREEDAKKIVLTWLETPFSGEERHRRRLEKIYKLELENENGGYSRY